MFRRLAIWALLLTAIVGSAQALVGPRRVLLSGGSPQIAAYAADVVSGAINAWGTVKLHQAYAGNAISAKRTDNSATSNIGFAAGGFAANAALSAFCSGLNTTYLGPYCVSTEMFDQIGSCPLVMTANMQLSTAGLFPTLGNSYSLISSSLAGTQSGYSTVACVNPNATASTVVVLGAAITSGETLPYYFTATTSPGSGGINLAGGSVCGSYGSNSIQTTAIIPQTPWVAAMSYGTGLGVNSVYVSCGGATANNFTSYTNAYTMANVSIPALLASNTQIVAEIVFGRALSPTEVSKVQTALLSAYGLPSSLPNGGITCVGDSRTAGVGTTLGNDTWCKMLELDANFTTKYYNSSHSAFTCGQMQTGYAANEAHAYNASNTDNIINLWCGTNDIAVSTSAATIYSEITSYVSGAHATGFKVVCATELYNRTWSGAQQAIEASLLILIHANTAGCDAIADLEAQPNIGGTSGPNATYSPDGLHLVDIGYQIVASTFRAADQSICSNC